MRRVFKAADAKALRQEWGRGFKEQQGGGWREGGLEERREAGRRRKADHAAPCGQRTTLSFALSERKGVWSLRGRDVSRFPAPSMTWSPLAAE